MKRSTMCWFLIMMAVLLAFCAPAPGEVTFHVAVKGSDQGIGTTDRPFATIERARDAVRELKRNQGGVLNRPVTVYVHGGRYALSQPLRFTTEDSGTLEAPVTYAAFKDEKPVLSGGRQITGWKKVDVSGKSLWVADVPDVQAGKWYFRELWINGERRNRARNPNSGVFRISAVPDLDLKARYNRSGQSRFQYAPGEIGSWNNLEDIEIVILSFWICTRRGIAAVDETEHMVTLSQRSTFRLTDGFGNPPKLARYYVENAFELLDAPGEWYLDRKPGKLYYMPLPGEDMASAETIAPVLEQLVLVEGSPREGNFVEYVTFRGLAFSHAEWWIPANDPSDLYQRQAAAPMPAAVQLWGARNFTIESCVFAHLGNYAMQFSRGCSQSKLVHCEMFDLGAGGVKVGNADQNMVIRPDRDGVVHDHPSEQTYAIEVTDNHIYAGSRVFHQGHGIWVGQSYDNLVAHNHIHDFYQIGINVGWTWRTFKTLARNNVIEYNHIHHIGQGWSSDLAAIYALGRQPGTVIRYNLLHDVEAAEYVGRGVYLDSRTAEVLVEKNIVYNTSTAGFGTSNGIGNTIRNNIFAFGRDAQIEPNGGRNLPGDGFTYEHNIVYWKKGRPLLRQRWNEKGTVIRNNLYWQEGGGEIRFGRDTWEQWRALGRDEGSLIADPLFVDPTHFDFRLKPGSPASKIGFEPFDLSGVGPRPIRVNNVISSY